MTYDEVYKIIKKNIKKYRMLKGLKQQQLADMLNMSLNFIGKIEVGYDHPSIYTLVDISNCLEIPIEKLFQATDDSNQQ